MVVFLHLTGESPAKHNLPTRDGKILAAEAPNRAKSRQHREFCALS
jgi:hypothetical protein